MIGIQRKKDTRKQARYSFCRSGEHLMGSQTMRIRLLKMMGFKVMTVKLQLASQLLVHPRKLREYLQEQYREASMAPKELK